MPKLFITGIVLFLLFGAGYGILQAARSIPWNCDDWQPYPHADRTTAILESLAENRGKTLYCGLDQSDTFAKAETWAAGKDRNERDDTVYWGERGSFRGFIAAQEGWLTEGESGITGQSIATIFEFPKEERRRRRTKVKRYDLNGEVSSCGRSQTPPTNCAGGYDTGTTIVAARTDFNTNIHSTLDWPLLAKDQAKDICRVRHGGQSVTNLVIDDSQIAIDHNALLTEPRSIWYNQGSTPNIHAYQIRLWTATCVKKIKGPRRR